MKGRILLSFSSSKPSILGSSSLFSSSSFFYPLPSFSSSSPVLCLLRHSSSLSDSCASSVSFFSTSSSASGGRRRGRRNSGRVGDVGGTFSAVFLSRYFQSSSPLVPKNTLPHPPRSASLTRTTTTSKKSGNPNGEVKGEQEDTAATATTSSPLTQTSGYLTSTFSSLWNKRIGEFTNFRREEHSSRSAKGPQYGVGFDPVQSYAGLQRATGPLQRRYRPSTQEDSTSSDNHHHFGGITRPEEYFSPEEERRWMESNQAAKILQFKQEDLSTLTREVLEERWVKLYRERQFSPTAKEEVMVATEVLLTYLDSTTFTKKNRLYYHRLLENTREQIDLEIQRDKNAWQEWGMRALGILMLGAGMVVILVSAIRKGWVGQQVLSLLPGTSVERIGNTAGSYLTMSFLQPKNFEPPPDYNVRYFVTPSALEVEQKLAKEADQRLQEWNSMEDEEEEEGVREEAAAVALENRNNRTHHPNEDDEGNAKNLQRVHRDRGGGGGGAWQTFDCIFRRVFRRSEDYFAQENSSVSSSSSSPIRSTTTTTPLPSAPPSALSNISTRSSTAGVWGTSKELQIRQEKAAQDREEVRNLLQLFHEEQERKKRRRSRGKRGENDAGEEEEHQKKEDSNNAAASSACPSALVSAGMGLPSSANTGADTARRTNRTAADHQASNAAGSSSSCTAAAAGAVSSDAPPRPASFWDVSSALAHNFGGGSRIQRMMASTTERVQLQEELKKRMEERF